MIEEFWDRFVIYVNAYYAIQEALDASLRHGDEPASGLAEFCSDANPFLWDERSSAEPSVYEGFCATFSERFDASECTPQDGFSFARDWLASMEGERYGSALVSSLDFVTDLGSWIEACDAIARQLAMRAAYLERSPQEDFDSFEELESLAMAAAAQKDEPSPVGQDAPTEENDEPATPTAADVEAVIALLSKGDEAFAESLRARLADV